MFVDISGFTTLTGRLSQRGAEGLEELASALDGYFSTVLDPILSHGGDALKLVGDALIVL